MPIAEVTPTLKHADLNDEELAQVGGEWHLSDESGCADVGARYREGLAIGDGPNCFALVQDGSLAPEQYTADIRAASIEIRAASRRGFLYALSTLDQLRDGPALPTGQIDDQPRLPVRGLQFMFESVKQLRFADAMSLLESAARHKLNTVLMEFGDRFPFEGKHEVIASPSALTRDELQQLVARAGELGITIIPLLQSLGHLGYLLKHDQYADVREEDEIRHQLCPLNEGSFPLWTELAEQVLDFFPGCSLMHIGADETRQLGVCPECAAAAGEIGDGGLYIAHTNKVCEWLDDRGIAPIIWDDILCTHPALIDELHPAAQIMYWDYWTTCDPSPLLVARGCSPTVCYDERWNSEWAGELSPITRKALDEFAGPADLTASLTDDYVAAYRGCLGEDFPKFVRAFPYLEHYQAKGRVVFGAPTCSGNHSFWHGLPDLPRHGENIKTFADRCIEASAAGMITSAWYNRSAEFLHWGILATAEFTW